MDPLRLIAETDGYFTRAMARDCGYSNREIDAMHRQRTWLRFRHGYYTFPDLWEPLDEAGRHRIRCRAVMHALGPRVALSHISSIVMRGVDPWGYDLSRVHVTRLDNGAGRVEGDIVHHAARIPTEDVVVHDGLAMTSVDRSTIEAATQGDSEAALCLFNQVLHAEMATIDQLSVRFEAMAHWPRTQRLHIPIRMADPRSESVGESRGNWFFRRYRIPAPVPQFEVYDADGVLRGTCDWGWPDHRQLGEFDGRVKYGRLLRPGQHAGDVVFAEKIREDELREITGYGMIRLTWGDYDRPRLTVARLHRGLGIAS
ncbi:type IV toxin-antitoxin system AbiEi family antitoxin domain-containing protein [Nocardioides euryhalodurans]|uniref:Type IV toxin-antitoxin system AbiEi family antitoxin domain-containing protein n=1 Tax=Nocardioides euryhalodurans TaxID=2518370 RepID=A0A4P7GIX3_9ACTN|nr:type IV toxin-antitoxin system AbiEi family antitoxin domain-containing protein [Nocardioides euryhalodurans]QBR91677.1 hypothetical protein EXE57_04900 [Nocardioides euryhalodurans]